MQKRMADNQRQNTTKLIVIKDWADRGKSLTIWMVLMELIRQGANVNWCKYTFGGKNMKIPAQIPPYQNRWDFVADLTWKGKHIAIVSHGDDVNDVDRELQNILPTKPNYIICAANIRHWGASVWNMIEKKYTNTAFERLCFWTEYAANKIDEQLVKRPTVEAIVKYIA